MARAAAWKERWHPPSKCDIANRIVILRRLQQASVCVFQTLQDLFEELKKHLALLFIDLR